MVLCCVIPVINKLWLGTILHLLKWCNTTTTHKSYQLYTTDTCREFHQVLCCLLADFKLALEDLQTLQADLTLVSHFTSALSAVILLGCALHLLARSSAIKCHLQVIMSQLLGKKHSGETKQEDVPHKDLQCIQPPMLQDDKPELSGSEGSGETIKGKEHNEDLQCVQPSALQDNDQSTPRSTVWKSFGDWLNLIMVHFDTINTLSHFVISRLPGGIHNVYASSTHHLGAASLGDAVTIKALPHQVKLRTL